jgi:EmrB/QacA subfamily drug resistance transporter
MRGPQPAGQSWAVDDRRMPRWAVLAALTLVTFLVLLDDTAVSVALPSVQRELGLSLGGLEWVVNSYTLAIAAFTLLAGRLADRNGARRIFLAGLATFLIGSLGAGLAPNATALIASRAMQGLGSALLGPASLALIASTFHADRRGAALGMWAGVSASALGIGPLVGAVVNDTIGWRWIFLLNVPLGGAAWLVARTVLPSFPPAATPKRVDALGAICSATALITLLLGLNLAHGTAWTAWPVMALFTAASASFVLFGVHESRTPDPLLDLAMFTDRSFTGANMVTLLSTAVMCSLFFFLALYFQTVLGYSGLASGATLLPLTLTIIITAPLVGRIVDAAGARLLIVSGMVLLSAALLGLSRLGLDASPVLTMVWLSLAGLGIALTKTPTTTVALGSADDNSYGVAAGVLNTFQATGLAIGIALMGAILAAFGPNAAFGREFDQHHHQAFIDGFSTALRVNSGIAFLAAMVAAFTIKSARSLPTRRRRPSAISRDSTRM